jgi:predicted metal-binding transcription factor (methanogenesis marker protein 9)
MRKEVNLKSQLFDKLISSLIDESQVKKGTSEVITEAGIKQKIEAEMFELFNKAIN